MNEPLFAASHKALELQFSRPAQIVFDPAIPMLLLA
jgi:hypothetical protein